MKKHKLIIQLVILPLMLLYGQRVHQNGSDYTMGNLTDDFQVNNPDSFSVINSSYSDIAYNDSGDFVVVWSDNRNGDYDIIGQLYSSDGSPNGENFKINDDKSNGSQSDPTVSFDKQGNFIVAWHDERGIDRYSNISKIYGQAFDKTGYPIGTNFMVTHPDSVGNFENPDIEFRSDGSFVVIWWGTFRGVFAQIYSNNIEKVGDPIVVFYSRYDYSSEPDLTVNSNGDFAVTWQSDKKHDGKSLMQLLDRKGNKTDTTIIFQGGSKRNPNLEYLTNGKLVFAWIEYVNQSENPLMKQRVCVQILSENGTIISDIIQVDSDAEYSFGNLSLSSDSSSQFVITWTRNENIYAQRFVDNGTNIGESFLVNNISESSHRYKAAISSNSNGKFIITWLSYLSGKSNIYFQQYTEIGDRINNNTNTFLGKSGSPQSNSVIEVGSDGKYIIAWEDEKDGVTSIYAKIYDEQNRPICSAIKLVDDGVNTDQHYPVIAINGDDKIFVVWYGRRENKLNNVYGQLLSMDGEKIGLNIKISDTENNWGAEIGSGESDNFVVTWTHYTESRIGDGIYGQRLNTNGEKLGAIFRVSEKEYWGSHSAVAVNYDDSFIVSWMGPAIDRNEAVLARRFSSEAIPLEKSFIVTLDEGNSFPHGLNPPVIIDSSGNVVICWTEYISDGDYGILYSKFNYSGPVTISNTLINGPLPKWFSEIPIDDNGDNFIVVWEEFIEGSYNVLAQQVGDSMGEIFRITNTSNGIQSHPNIKVKNNKIYSTWTDNRIKNSGFDVWANVLNWDSPTAINEEILVDEFNLLQNYPNPFNPSTTIKYSISRSTEYYSVQQVTLKIFDVLGREVATLVNNEQHAGNYEVNFDASGLSSGLYFYKLNSGSYSKTMKMLLLK